MLVCLTSSISKSLPPEILQQLAQRLGKTQVQSSLRRKGWIGVSVCFVHLWQSLQLGRGRQRERERQVERERERQSVLKASHGAILPERKPDNVQPAEEPQEEGALVRAARSIHSLARSSKPRADFCNSHYLRGLLRALAHIGKLSDEAAFGRVIHCIRAMQDCGLIEAQALMHHSLYDETPLRLSVNFASAPSPSEVKVGKIFIVENEWLLLLKRTADIDMSAGHPGMRNLPTTNQ